MANDNVTKLKLAAGTFECEFEGSEAFLRTEVPKFIKIASDLQTSTAKAHLAVLQTDIERSLRTKAEIEGAIDVVKDSLDSLSEMGEMESLRLQMAMDRMSKLMTTLSNLLKKISETSEAVVQNIK